MQIRVSKHGINFWQPRFSESAYSNCLKKSSCQAVLKNALKHWNFKLFIQSNSKTLTHVFCFWDFYKVWSVWGAFCPETSFQTFWKDHKGINPSSLPPCKASLVEKIKRSHFVASVWKRATLSDTVVLDPEEYGWKLQDGHYVINWYDGQQVPDDIYEKLENLVNHDDEDDIYASSCPSSD